MKQFTRAEVKENGEYVGYVPLNGGTVQFFELGGIVFSETCDKNGFRCSWNCVGRKSKAGPWGTRA